MSKALILVIVAELWTTAGQICFKKSANRINLEAKTLPWIVRLFGFAGRDPLLWWGATAMVIGMLFWFAALSSGPLNLVYLLGSMQYIFALVASHFLLRERITVTKLIGTLLIISGIILTATS